MPAYVQHHEVGSAAIVCPNCICLAMYVRDVEPHWRVSKIDFVYECSECGTEIKKTLTKPDQRLAPARLRTK